VYLLNVDKLELLVCLSENCEQSFLGGGKAHDSCSVEVLGSQTGILKGLKKKSDMQEGRKV